MRLLVVVLSAWFGLAVLTAVIWSVVVAATRAAATRRALAFLNTPAPAPTATRRLHLVKRTPAATRVHPPA
jgi:hypothetical protein